MDMTTMVPTLPVLGVKLTPLQLPPTQPSPAAEVGINDETSSVNKAA